jgi:hypothetical protein
VASTSIAYPQHWEMLKADPGFVDLMMDTLPVERAEEAARDLLARTKP